MDKDKDWINELYDEFVENPAQADEWAPRGDDPQPAADADWPPAAQNIDPSGGLGFSQVRQQGAQSFQPPLTGTGRGRGFARGFGRSPRGRGGFGPMGQMSAPPGFGRGSRGPAGFGAGAQQVAPPGFGHARGWGASGAPPLQPGIQGVPQQETVHIVRRTLCPQIAEEPEPVQQQEHTHNDAQQVKDGRPALDASENDDELTAGMVTKMVQGWGGHMAFVRPGQLGRTYKDYAKNLAKFLEQEKGFRILEIKDINHEIMSIAVARFAESLEKYSNLRKVKLEGTTIEREAVYKLVEALKVHNVIEELEFSFMQFDFNCAVMLAEVFTNIALKKVKLRGNFGDRGLGALLSGLRHNNTLEEIVIISNSVIMEDLKYYKNIYDFDQSKTRCFVVSTAQPQTIEWALHEGKKKQSYFGGLF